MSEVLGARCESPHENSFRRRRSCPRVVIQGDMLDRVLIFMRQVVGPYCGGSEEGDQLRSYLETIWDRYETIQLNFLGVETTSFRFFYGAFGPLARRYSLEGLLTKLTFFELSQQEELWLNRAIRYSLR